MPLLAHETGSAVDVAVVFAEPSAATVFVERVGRARRLQGAGFASVVGIAQGARVAAAWPTPPSIDLPGLVAAIGRAHRPRLLVGAGWSHPKDRAEHPEQPVLVSHAFDAEAAPSAFLCPANFPGLVGAVGGGSHAGADCLAVNSWCRDFAAAASAFEAVAAATVINPSLAGEVAVPRSVPQRARAAGRLLRESWLRPSNLMDKLEQKTLDWRRQEMLADAVAWLIAKGLSDLDPDERAL